MDGAQTQLLKILEIIMMMMIRGFGYTCAKLFSLFFFSLFLFIHTGYAQERYEWISATVLFDLPKKFNVSITEESRLRNLSGILLNQTHTELEVQYKGLKNIDLACIYRFAQKREDNQYFYSRHRFNTEASYENDIKRFGFSYRLRYQYQTKQFKEDAFDEIPDHHIRNRVKFTYNIRRTKLEPYIFTELFNPLNRYEEQFFDEYRIGGGIRFPLNKKNRLNLGLFYNYEIDNSPTSAWIFTLGYRWEAN